MLENLILDELREEIDKNLEDLLKNKKGFQKKLYEAMKYSLFTGGKRIRPILLLKSCELFGGNYKDYIAFAMAIEMIHTYSLIHDDLPSMDNDEFRRGHLTNHMVYGEAIAILAGDGLLNLAFETMLEHALSGSKTSKEYEKNIKAMHEIGKYSGVEGMIGGQVVDLLSNDISIDEKELLFMYKSKTAGLIQASLVSGAILGGASNEDVDKMRDFGFYLGLAYQIRDDILDKEEDKKIDKLTYLKYNSVSEAECKIDELSENAIKILSGFNTKDIEFLRRLTNKLIKRNV